MIIAVCQMKVIPANPVENGIRIKQFVVDALHRTNRQVDMVVFPELAVPGYLIGDIWEEQAFLRECQRVEQTLREYALEKCVTIVFGNVATTTTKQHDGRPTKYNALIVAHRRDDTLNLPEFTGAKKPFIAKTLLPNYREFDELRHFTPNKRTDNIRPVDISDMKSGMGKPPHVSGLKVGFALCEDGWDDDYEIKPMQLLASRGAEILINHSCSPFTVGKNGKRNRVFGAHAKNAGVPLIYVNAIGLQNNAKTIFSFDGSSVLYDKNGNVVYESPMFEEDMFIYNTKTNEVTHRFTNVQKPQHTDIGDIYNALVFSIREYCAQSGIQNVVIGSSGGVDSAVSAALHVAALGAEHVYLVNMPSKYNSDTTKGLSYHLSINLGTPYVTVPISESVDLTATQINGLTFRTPDGIDFRTLELSGFNLENVQARDRSSRILAAIASALPGGVFSNNGNKTETTVGYATLYGDVAGYVAAIADLWKEDVYLLGKYINHINGREIIPVGIFSIVASAELSGDQNVDEGKGDPIIYMYHDRLFKAWMQTWNRKTPEEILEWYADGKLEEMLGFPTNEFGERKRICDIFGTRHAFIADLERWWNLFKGMAVAKRTQAPPVIAITPRAYGFDYRDALNCVYYTTRYRELKKKLLDMETV